MESSTKYEAVQNAEECTGQIVMETDQEESILLAWWKEILAIVVAIGTMIGLIKLLLFYNNKELPKWKGNLTLNFVASLLVVLQRGMLMIVIVEVISNSKWSWYRRRRPLKDLITIDDAGKGPVSAIQLMFRLPSNLLAILAAAVAILSFGMGPLTQQAVQAVPCSLVSKGARASIPVAQNVDHMSFRYGAHSYTLKPASVAKMFSGLTSPDGTDWKLDADCPTGQCTFKATYNITHSTMGICNSCIDVTSKVENKHNEYNLTTVSLPGSTRNITSGSDAIGVTNEYNQSWTRGMETHFDRVAPSAFSGLTIMSFTLNGCIPNGTDHLPSWYGSIFQPGLENNPYYTMNVVASSCVIYPCVKNFYGTVSNGKFQETLISTVPAQEFKPEDPFGKITIINSPCVSDNQTLDNTVDISTLPNNAPNTFQIDILGRNVSVPVNCLYQMSGVDALAFGEFFNEYFDNSCSFYDRADIDSILCTRNNWYMNTLYNGGFASHASISAAVNRITDAATNMFRLSGLNWERTAPANVSGDVLRETVCAKLQIQWLLFPITLLSLSAMLLAATLVLEFSQNGRVGAVPVWKSSMLPLLYHGLGKLDDEPRDNFPRTLKELEKRAEEVEVRLGMGETHWGLIKEGLIIEGRTPQEQTKARKTEEGHVNEG
ncbi:DUF3176 domain containing protein [Pyrenophora tritici-repentis]|nr:DUF3176 domain containing protein [Pyrenophora tritici-repentis]